MGFEKFGVRSFVRDLKGDAFVRGLEEGRVTATRCRSCRKTSFPPRPSCPQCWSEEVEWVEIEGPGRLVAFTKVFYGPAGFENLTPYTLGVVEFPSGVRMFGQVDRDSDDGTIKVGAKMTPVAVRTGGEMVSYRFQKVHEA